MISYIIIIFTICISYTTIAAPAAAELPTAATAVTTSTELLDDDRDLYSLRPNEILPIQPILVYPKYRDLTIHGRTLLRDNEIIYVKLLKHKGYRPQKLHNQIADDDDDDDVAKKPPKELQMKDIFYVKALANGQFSHNRLKLYRLPEFYAISVYKKGELME